jgi:hypothetical protein
MFQKIFFAKVVSGVALSASLLTGFSLSISTNAQATNTVGQVQSVVTNDACGVDTVTISGWSTAPSLSFQLNYKDNRIVVGNITPVNGQFSTTFNGSFSYDGQPKLGFNVSALNLAPIQVIAGTTILPNPATITRGSSTCNSGDYKIIYKNQTGTFNWGTKRWDYSAAQTASKIECKSTAIAAKCNEIIDSAKTKKNIFLFNWDHTALPEAGTSAVDFARANLPAGTLIDASVKGVMSKNIYGAYCNDDTYNCQNRQFKWIWYGPNGQLKSGVSGVNPPAELVTDIRKFTAWN